MSKEKIKTDLTTFLVIGGVMVLGIIIIELLKI